jgi:hypothetical protein
VGGTGTGGMGIWVGGGAAYQCFVSSPYAHLSACLDVSCCQYFEYCVDKNTHKHSHRIAKGCTIAIKYSFKSDYLVSTAADNDICLFRQGYQETNQGKRGQMTTYVLNMFGGDIQKEELINFVYKSCLIANTDLSCTAFCWESLKPRGVRIGGQARMRGGGWVWGGERDGGGSNGLPLVVWEAMLEITRGVEVERVFAETDADQSGDISLEEMHARAKAGAPSVLAAVRELVCEISAACMCACA